IKLIMTMRRVARPMPIWRKYFNYEQAVCFLRFRQYIVNQSLGIALPTQLNTDVLWCNQSSFIAATAGRFAKSKLGLCFSNDLYVILRRYIYGIGRDLLEYAHTLANAAPSCIIRFYGNDP